MHQDALWEESKLAKTVPAMFCWETMGPGLYVDFTFNRTTNLNIILDQEQPFMGNQYNKLTVLMFNPTCAMWDVMDKNTSNPWKPRLTTAYKGSAV